MRTMDIYFNDLNDETKEKVLELFKLKSPEEGNLDVLPLFTLEVVDFNVDEEDQG